VFEGQVRGLEDRDLNGDYLFEQLLLTADGVVIICYDQENTSDPVIRHPPAGHTVIGLKGRFDQILHLFARLEGRCNIILNDYSTAKFFPASFPTLLSRLTTPDTGFALLQDIRRRGPVVPYTPDDMRIVVPTKRTYRVSLFNGATITVATSSSAYLAQVLYQAQRLSGISIARDTVVVFAGRQILADDSLFHIATDSTLHLILRPSVHWIESYETLFDAYQMTGYPIEHAAQPSPTGVWMLLPSL